MPIKGKVYNLLRKTEKYTKTDNVYIAKGSFWLSLARFGTLLIALAMGMIWARFVPQDVYGQYKFILSIASLLAIFSLSGMKSAVTQAVARNFAGTVKQALKARLRWGMLALLAGLSLAVYYWVKQDVTLSISFLIAGLLSPIINSFPLYTSYLEGKKNFSLKAKLDLAKGFLAALITASVIILTNNTIYLVLVYFSSRSILSILFYVITFKQDPIPSQENSVDKSSLVFGKHLSLMGVLNLVAMQIDKILIFHYVGAVQLAIYSFATILPDNLKSVTKSMCQLALPKLSTRSAQEIKKTAFAKTVPWAILLTSMVALYIAFCPLIFKIFFPTYTGAILYSRIYSLNLLGGIGLIPGVAFTAKRRTKILYKQNISMAVIKISILFLSLYFFGLLGLIIAITIHNLLNGIVNFILLRYL